MVSLLVYSTAGYHFGYSTTAKPPAVMLRNWMMLVIKCIWPSASLIGRTLWLRKRSIWRLLSQSLLMLRLNNYWV